MLLIIWGIYVFSLVFADVNEKQKLAKSTINSHFRGLETPLVEAAAAVKEEKIISLGHNSEDENNLDRLCNDPFHSFLCKPIGPRRRRIDGNLRPGAILPEGIRPAATNLREQKQPLDEGSSLLPTSIENEKMYLPPKFQPPPHLQPEPQFLPPEISNDQKLQPLPSNPSSRFLLPSVKITTNKPIVLNQNRQQSVNKLSIASQNSTTIHYYSGPTNMYLPVKEIQAFPESTNLSPVREGKTLLADEISRTSNDSNESSSLQRLCNDPFHSFLCKPVKPRKRIDGNIRPGAKLPPTVLKQSSSTNKVATVPPLVEGKFLLSSSSSNDSPSIAKKYNSEEKSYNSITDLPLCSYVNPQNVNIMQQSSNRSQQISETKNVIKPTIASLKGQNGISLQSESKLEHSGNSQNVNVHDTYKQKEAELLNLKQLRGYPSDIQKSILPFSSPQRYYYIPPRNPLSYPETTESALKNNNIVTNPYNVQEALLQLPVTGHNYPKPSQPLASTTTIGYLNTDIYQVSNRNLKEEGIHSFSTSSDTQKSKFNSQIKTSELPETTTSNMKYPTTNPISQFPLPSNVYKNIVESNKNGYQYNKPLNKFNDSPTNIFLTTVIPANTKQPYQYNGFINQTENPGLNGKNYSRPLKQFATSQLSTTNNIIHPERPLSTTPTPLKEYPNPSNVVKTIVKLQTNGYNYDPPSQSFTYPSTPGTTAKPVQSQDPLYDYPNPTNIQSSFVKLENSGYRYEKPLRPFDNFPTSTTQIPFNPLPNPSNLQVNVASVESNNGYNYPIPINQLTLPSENKDTQLKLLSENNRTFLQKNKTILNYKTPGEQSQIKTKSQDGFHDDFEPLKNFEII